MVVTSDTNGFPSGTVAKNMPGNAGDTRDMGSIHSSILGWKIPWTEKPDYSSWGCKESRHNCARTYATT